MSETETAITSLVYLVGTFFVFMFAVRFFNDPEYIPDDEYVKNVLGQDPKMSPALPKYVTEKSRYHLYLGTFIFITVVLYYFISLVFPSLVSNMLGLEIEIKYSVALVIGTLAFISLSTKIPYIKKILTEWKTDLHKRAKIPDKAMYVFNSLRFTEINKSSEEFRKYLDEILNSQIGGEVRSDIDKDYFYFDKDRIERKWARLVYLMHAIEKWSKVTQFERHLKTESLKWLTLRSYYLDKLVPKMKQFRQGTLDEDSIKTTKENIDALSIKVYWLITLLLFMANKAAEDPCIHLKKIGWIVTPDKYFKFSSKQIIFTGSAIFISILIGALISAVILLMISDIESAKFDIKPTMIFYWLIYGIPMFVIPSAVTMLLKRFLSMNGVWTVQHPEDPKIPFSQRPWNIYFFVGLASYLATFAIIQTLFLLISLVKEPVTAYPILAIAVYSGLGIIASLFLCYLIDTPSPGWETSLRYYLKSFFPALIQGMLNVTMITFAFLLLTDSDSFNVFSLDQEQFGRLVVYAVIGFIIGVFMYMTSRIGTKYYERRESEIIRSTEGWWTIRIDSIIKRVETMNLNDKLLDIIADDELINLANIDDTIEFYNRDKLAMSGNVEEINGEFVRISLQAQNDLEHFAYGSRKKDRPRLISAGKIRVT